MSEPLAQHVVKHMPRCLHDVAAQPIIGKPTRGAQVVAFQISSHGGQAAGELLGYSLSKLDSKYSGPPEFVSPLFIRWPGSERVSGIFDSRSHGYHAEIGSNSAKRTGQGEPDVWTCPKCGKSTFTVVMCFDYYGGAMDLWEDEPELPIENYFNGLRVFVTCVECKAESQVLGMDL